MNRWQPSLQMGKAINTIHRTRQLDVQQNELRLCIA